MIPVQPIHDRENMPVARMQVGYIEHFVAPVAFLCTRLMPSMQPCEEHMLENLEEWLDGWRQYEGLDVTEFEAVEERCKVLLKRKRGTRFKKTGSLASLEIVGKTSSLWVK